MLFCLSPNLFNNHYSRINKYAYFVYLQNENFLFSLFQINFINNNNLNFKHNKHNKLKNI